MNRTVELIILAKEKVSGDLKKVEGSFAKLQASAQAAIVPFGALTAAGTALIAKTTSMAMEEEQLGKTFESLAESIGTTSDALLEKLRPATMSTLSDTELMAAANKLMAMGLADTSDKAGELADMAVTLGSAMGVDATRALEDFTLMLANQSIPRLDTFGISSGQVRLRIEELQEATEDMTREEAFMIAVTEQGRIAMGKVGDVSGSTAVQMAQLRSSIANLSSEIGSQFLPYLSAGLNMLNDLIDQFKSSEGAIARNIVGLVGYGTAMAGAVTAVSSIIIILPKLQALMTGLFAPPGGLFILAAAAIAAVAVRAVQVRIEFEKLKGEIQEDSESVGEYVERMKELRGLQSETAKGARSLAGDVGKLMEAKYAAADAFEFAAIKAQEMDAALRSEQDEYIAAAEAAYRFEQAVVQAATEADLSMSISLGRTLLDLRDNIEAYRELESTVTTVYADTSDIVNRFNSWRSEQEASLQDRLVELEQERAEKIAWVQAGAHARSAAENEEALAHWHGIYDAERDKLIGTVNEKIAARENEKKQDIARAQEAAAERSRIAEQERLEEMERLRAAQEERILLFGLEMLAYKDQLQVPIEGFEDMEISADEFLALTEAGIIPLTDQLRSDLGGALTDLAGSFEETGGTGEKSMEDLSGIIQETIGDVMDMGTETDNLETTTDKAQREMRGHWKKTIERLEEYTGGLRQAIRLQNTLAGLEGGGGAGGVMATAQAGIRYVPMPMPAMLHTGEAVLTRTQAEAYRQGGGGETNIHVYAGGVYGMDGAEALIEDMIREQARYVR